MSESNLNPDVALSIFRGLAGCKDYPFHVEGEMRRAAVLVENCASVAHARAVISEFDEAPDCPTVEALRAAAKRLAEVCRCGKAKWAHREPGACRAFSGAPSEDEGWTKTAAGYTKFRQTVPPIPGVAWEVALQVQSLKISIRPGDDEKYPEACASVRAGRDPDYRLLESQMRALYPHMWKGSKGLNTSSAKNVVASIDVSYTVESVTPE